MYRIGIDVPIYSFAFLFLKLLIKLDGRSVFVFKVTISNEIKNQIFKVRTYNAVRNIATIYTLQSHTEQHTFM